MILTPAVREQLITLAKSRAEPVANCVAASVPFAHLVSDLPREGLYALIAVLGEGADRHRLHAIVTAGDDTPAVAESVPFSLRAAHAEYRRYLGAGIAVEDIPVRVRRGETAYQANAKRRQRTQRQAAEQAARQAALGAAVATAKARRREQAA